MYRYFAKPLLFRLPAETAHHFTFNLLKIPMFSQGLGWWHQFDHPSLKRELFGLTFRNPIGLAAGFDKNAVCYQALHNLGFGFVEIGTVTPEPQAGNPRPRLFRLPSDEALINRMGFNNDGMKRIVRRLENRRRDLIIGGNIGKNKVTPNEDAISDYEKCFHALYEYVDYFTVNVSSPNTPDLRALQDKEPLTRLLRHLQDLNHARSAPKPILLKIAPDLNNDQLDDIIDIVTTLSIDGLIATNTTIDRGGLTTSAATLENIGNGGLSGKPLTGRATEVIFYIHQKSKGRFPIIGVGGIHSAKEAREKLEAGASLIQLYTGFVYQGPQLIKDIKRELVSD